MSVSAPSPWAEPVHDVTGPRSRPTIDASVEPAYGVSSPILAPRNRGMRSSGLSIAIDSATGSEPRRAAPAQSAGTGEGVLVCLLGGFRVFKAGAPMAIQAGGKVEQVLTQLAMHPRDGMSREELIDRVWPTNTTAQANQSLNTLSHGLKRQLSDALCGDAPIVSLAGRCRLNTGTRLKVDLLEFDAALSQASSADDEDEAIQSYLSALKLYAGDLWVGSDIRQLLERERLRAAYLAVRARLAEHYFASARYDLSIHQAFELLSADPFREDAHRIAMRCYVRSSQRAQALRQYHTCRQLLKAEFDAVPEPATDALYDLIRCDPGAV